MKQLALLSIFFDYPDYHLPIFYNKAQQFLDKEDIHVARFNNQVEGSYYDKLYTYKVVKLLDYIEKNLKDYKYILFMDATDTGICGNLNEIVDRFLEFNCSILFGAEKGFWPPTNFTHLYEKKPCLTDAKYFNSGTYIGHTEKIIYHLKDIIEKEHQTGIDDQGRWTIQYLLNTDILTDQERKIFFSTYEAKEHFDIVDNKVVFKSISPLVIHDNGGFNETTIKLAEHFK